MGLQILNNDKESILVVDVNIEKSTSTSIVVEFSGMNDIYVGTWIIHLWNNDPNSTKELEMLDVKEIYLERGSSYGSVTFSGLTPNTTYYIGVVTGDYSTWGEDSFPFTTASNIEEIEGFVITKEVTSNSASITVLSSQGDNGKYYYDLFLVNPEISEEHIWVAGGSKIWDAGENMVIEYHLYDLAANTTYWLETGIPDLGTIEFTTDSLSIFLTAVKVTASSIRVRVSKRPKDQGYEMVAWYIRKAGDSTILDSDEYELTNVSRGRYHTFDGLEANTKYYIWIELVDTSPERYDILGIYATTSQLEEVFSWDYAGIIKDEDGIYEPLIGGTKGADGAEYFYLTFDEWKRYVTLLCETKDKQDLSSLVTDGTLDRLKGEPKGGFRASIYNEVLRILYDLETVGEMPEEQCVKPGDGITPKHLNDLKDRLNKILS